MSVLSEGAGEPLVLVHGFGGDRHTWDYIYPALCADRQVVCFDLRGYGQSEEPGRLPFRHARDLLAVLDALQITRCDVLGVSMGGSIALNLALDFPQRLRRLLLISPAIVGWEWSQAWRQRWAQITLAARNDDMSRARELWINHPLFATTLKIPHAAKALRESINRYSGRQWLYDNEASADPDLDRLMTLSVPVTLMTGEYDVPDFRLIAQMIEAAVPDVSRVDFGKAGHLLQLERAEEMIQQVKRATMRAQ